jgi:uncharacterized membrane protein
MSYPPQEYDESKSNTVVWTATVLLILSFVIGLLIFPPLYEAPKGEAASTVLFIGRFHPILLHLPVGALIVLSIMELACLTSTGEYRFGSAALLTLWIGAAGSVLAVLAGIMLSREGGYTGGNFTLHQTLALVGTAGVLLALCLRLYAMGQQNRELMHAYRAVFFGSFGLMSLGAHFGGNMSHGSKFLTEHAPEPMKSQMITLEKWMLSMVEPPKASANESKAQPAVEPVTPAPKPAPAPSVEAPAAKTLPAPNPNLPPASVPSGKDKLVFQDVILPIFAAKCNKCHGEEKQKGDLRMDTFESLLIGGENAAEKKNNIVPGKPDESLTIQSIVAPIDDDVHMPPEGKDQLTPAEISAIRYWVQAGASATQKISDAQFPADAKEALPQ